MSEMIDKLAKGLIILSALIMLGMVFMCLYCCKANQEERTTTVYAKVKEKHSPEVIDYTNFRPIKLKPLLILSVGDSVTIESGSYSLFNKMEVGDSVEVKFYKVTK